MHRIVRRGLLATAAGTAAVAMAAGSASAHHCFVPMYTLNGPTSSANWIVYTAEAAATDPEIAGITLGCPEAAAAGYEALEAAGLPVGIKIFAKMTIGDPKGEGRIPNPNGANGKGMEYFGAGSTLADQMLETWIGAAMSHDCG
ncbi:hypothetical protein BJF81_10140 [Ornithinimicrobium sp. CNJ-824]|uniref:hypothetical protein n=1 Tax=Ornithinimicrobium sp. CNJ-824 TaxID=1904966 RepID=UPI000968F818|nr:hypothetical protein [Ornithinimicrobium sp. CNJ-824]OLT23694.1 hypothetical protein BJF81_10140 [Ornithinimicrobium sp. CNJ-824]